MSRSRHHGCGGTCGMCKPHKKWRGNYKRNKKPSDRELDDAVDITATPSDEIERALYCHKFGPCASCLAILWDTPEEDEAWKDL